MKKILLILLILPLLCGTAAGQGQLQTRKYRLSDFSDKITKVVLTGNEMEDSVLRQAVMDRWTLSPFEFCTVAEFNKMKASTDFYFLVAADEDSAEEKESATPTEAKGKEKGKEKEKDKKDNDKEAKEAKEVVEAVPTIRTLTLLKGAKGSTSGGTMQVISIPLSTAGVASGRELVFLPAFIEIIQDYTREAMAKEVNGYTGLGRYNVNYRRDGKTKRILFSEGDIATAVNETFRDRNMDEDMVIVPEDEADRAFSEGTFNTLVSYVVRPAVLEKDAVCYLMLIEADTHTLYFYKKQKIAIAEAAGFMPGDIKALSRGRK